MRFAGIAWTGTGFEVAVLDDAGQPAAAAHHVPAGSGTALAELLGSLDRPGDQLVCIVESTNGMVDGGLMAAGMRVHRADPWTLPARPGFGSVDARALAHAGATRLTELPRLFLEQGSLTGRSADHETGIRESEAGLSALRAAGRCFTAGDPSGGPVIALTFDDGPNPPHTGRILDVLDRYDVPATFFCVGLHASACTEELARMAEAGHGFGNHTWSHPFLPDLSARELAVQIERTDEAIVSGGGVLTRRMFRPPYGSRSPEVVAWLADQETGPTVVLWDVDAGDWAMPGAAEITATVLEQARPGSIALLHDGGGDRSQTAEALPAVIEGLLGRGYRFELVADLLP